MAALPTSGGVRSLLAKFENNNSINNNNNNNNSNNPDVSPPRGRPSDESDDTSSNRPLSKVRANLVSVERNAQGSPTPGILRRADSYGTDRDSTQRSATVSPSTQLETASTNSILSSSPQKVRTALATFQRNGDGNANGDRPAPAPAVKATLETTATRKVNQVNQVNPSTAPQSTAAQKPSDKTGHLTANKQPTSSRTIKKSASSVAIAKDTSIGKSNSRSTPSKDNKSAAAPTRSATVLSRITPQSDRLATGRTAISRNIASSARAERANTPSHDVSKNSTAQASPRSKTGTRSPTRPVRLPASLTTPTAASAAKTGGLARSQSHANLRSSPKTDSPKTLSRKPSTLRPDVSRLAAHSIPDRPKSRVSTTSSRGAHEEGFLARMMRPTASSASKMHDRIEPRSPPKLAKVANISRSEGIPEVPKIASKHKGPVPKPVSSLPVEPKAEKPVVKMAPVAEVATPEIKPDVVQTPPAAEVIANEPKPSVADSSLNAQVTEHNVEGEKLESATGEHAAEPVEETLVEEQAEDELAKEQPTVELQTDKEQIQSSENTQEQPHETVPETISETISDVVPDINVADQEKEQPVANPVPDAETAKEPEQPRAQLAEDANIGPSEPEHSIEEFVVTSQEPSSDEPSTEKVEDQKIEDI